MMGKPLAEGVWVEIIKSRWNTGCVGFIQSVDLEEGKYAIKLTKAPQGNAVSNMRPVRESFDDVIPLPLTLKSEDILDITNFAIDTKDKSWFLDLTSQLPLGNF